MSHRQTHLLDSLSAELSQQLKDHANQVLLEIIRPNFASQFAQGAPELAKFREAIVQSDSNDDDDFLRSFRDLVPITNYEPYRPFIAKFLAIPCMEADVKNMFAPGLPYFLAMTSMTSRNAPEIFPKYRPPPRLLQQSSYQARFPSEGTTLSPSSLRYWQVIKIECGDGQSSKDVAVCSMSNGMLRIEKNWDIENDKDRLDLWVPGQTDPYAISLIKNYRTFFILNALFALADRRVTTIRFLFANIFVIFLQHVEDEWPLLVECIEKGIIPDIEDLGDLRAPLEKHLTPNPVRAAELREIGPPVIQGWAVRVWPDLKRFVGITGGHAAISQHKVIHLLGPSVPIQSYGYGSSECRVAQTYHEGNSNTDFKVSFRDGVIEFRDVRSGEDHVLSASELVTGGHYEPIVTTRSGLWRYRLGDVIMVKGFAPDDGLPVINYLHRRDDSLEVAFGASCTESQLTNAIVSAAQQSIGQIVAFTIVLDDRDTPVTYGYLVELAGELRQDARMAVKHLFDNLVTASDDYRIVVWQGRSRRPTIRIVDKGTFAEYHRRKYEQMDVTACQVKVPVVVFDPTIKEWLLERVIMEL
ncbi:GH3 auxin-responsive promoter [Suillus clintonianus]|uniref:GH3 auxin-responsive promoter n=1 Tax=Suillus clintonianus TaxID=1904413 RepID=UPI001B88595E|nr:GH3 auxin-responsive promoter [Suillus clintonianus]KAG2121881.1 GH3 auxin-responsive promoter [Suillus clintonianus]